MLLVMLGAAVEATVLLIEGAAAAGNVVVAIGLTPDAMIPVFAAPPAAGSVDAMFDLA